MHRNLFATVFLLGGLVIASAAVLGSVRDGVGIPLDADEMAFSVGQTGCPTSPNYISNPGCSYPASTPGTCTTTSSGGSPSCCLNFAPNTACTPTPSWQASSGSDQIKTLYQSCGSTYTIISCYCAYWSNACFTGSSSQGSCGSYISTVPSC